jgi:hypothetical protein
MSMQIITVAVPGNARPTGFARPLKKWALPGAQNSGGVRAFSTDRGAASLAWMRRLALASEGL